MTQIKEPVQKLDTILYTERKGGLRVKHPCTLTVTPMQIEFTKSPFALKGEIRAMADARWHGYDSVNPKKVWSVENCHRNWFQLKYLMGQNPYEWWDRELIQHDYEDFNIDGETLHLRDHQRLMADTGLTYHYQIWGAEMGTGKEARLTTPVLTPTGWTTMGSLKVGDRLIDPEGGTCEVLSLHPQGCKEIFKVTFTDGSWTECGAEHLWRVMTPNWKHRGQGWKVLELQELVDKGLQYTNGNNKWYIPMVTPVDFDVRELRCNPYIMGYILGNGHLPHYQISVPDQETVDRLNALMTLPLKPTSSTECGEKIDYTIKCPLVRDAIDYYGLRDCRANSKFVPRDFLFNTIENRLGLLQGLLDSDGSPLANAGVEFCSASDQLASDMVFLVQSFGGTCHRGLREEPTYTYKGETHIGQPSHRIHGSFNSSTEPFRLTRKAQKYTIPTKYQPTRAIVSVESVGFDEAICIRVNSPTNCYVTEEFIVTHNTLSAQVVMEMSGVDNWLWVGPLKSLENIEREWEKWGLSLSWCKPGTGPELTNAIRDNGHNIYLTTYERLVKYMETRNKNDRIIQGVIFDESSRLKSATAQRSQAAQDLTDMLRATYGFGGYVILMSGTPSPKSPLDWWKQCLTKDTWVLTSQGPKQIGELSCGGSITVRVKDQFIKTNGFHFTGVKPVYKLETIEGYTVEATGDHRFKLVDGGWCELNALESGDLIELSNSQSFNWSGEGSFGDGYLLGFIPDDYTLTGEDPKCLHHKYLTSLSLKFGFNSSKVIPKDFEQSASSECLKGFICGLFDTDGSVDYNRLRITFSQIDKERVLTVQRMLTYFGIHSKLQTKKCKGGEIDGRKIKSSIVYILHITGDDAVKFTETIGFKHERKVKTLNTRVDKRHKHKSQFFATISKVEYSGEKDVYDIEVPGLNCFSANGLLAHNCEIAYPGFLKEGSRKALEERLAFLVKEEYGDQQFNTRKGWKDDEDKCDKCGLYYDGGPHDSSIYEAEEFHPYRESFNEVAYMYERLKGLVTIVHKKDALDLPDKIYEVDYCQPSPSIRRTAQALVKNAPNTITGITWLRELSDGFMYQDRPDGFTKCSTCKESEEKGKVPAWFDPVAPNDKIDDIGMLDEKYVKRLTKRYIECPRCNGTTQMPKTKRIARQVATPKEEKLVARLAQCDETGRIVIFAGFKGSIDRIKGICHKQGWDVVRCDGRGWQVTDRTDKLVKTDKPLNYWSDLESNVKVAFVAHPQSGGLSLNLTEARMEIFYSNDFNPESRSQAEDRIHRLGMDENKGVIIVDLVHLPSDEKIRTILKENRKLELMTMGDILGDSLDD